MSARTVRSSAAMLAAWLAASGATRADPGVAPAAARSQDAQHASAPPTDSIYQLRTALTGPDGKQRGLDVFRGHPVLIAMVYTSCKSMCPLIVQDLKRIDARLSEATRRATRVLLVSLDARRDDPGALRSFMARHELDARRWLVATPAPGDVRALAALLGVRYRALPNGELAHSALITLLDADGTPRAHLEGIAANADELIGAVEAQARQVKPQTAPAGTPDRSPR